MTYLEIYLYLLSILVIIIFLLLINLHIQLEKLDNIIKLSIDNNEKSIYNENNKLFIQIEKIINLIVYFRNIISNIHNDTYQREYINLFLYEKENKYIEYNRYTGDYKINYHKIIYE